MQNADPKSDVLSDIIPMIIRAIADIFLSLIHIFLAFFMSLSANFQLMISPILKLISAIPIVFISLPLFIL